MKDKEFLRSEILRVIKFGLVGVSNTVISYGVYAFLVFLNVNYIVASITGFLVSVINSFFWNNRFVFKKEEGKQRSLIKTFLKTLLSYAGTGLVLSNILLYVWVDILEISKYIAPIINLLITIPLNYALNRIWAFRTHDG